MDMKPGFSVIIPVFNKLPHLERSVNSVLRQSIPDWELIIVNDASTDGSAEKIREFKDKRIRFFDRPEAGAGGYLARNLGIDNAKSDWICFLDADDEWASDLLEVLRGTIEQYPQVECLSWGYFHVSGNDRKLDKTSRLNNGCVSKHFSLTDFFSQRHTLWTGAVAFRKELLVSAGKFPVAGFKRGGDVDTWIRCLIRSRENVWLNRPMSYYYQDAVNMVTKTVQRESPYIFSSSLVQLLNETKDAELKRAIRKFQNERIYSIVRGQMMNGGRPDFRMIRKMNWNPSGILLVARLMARRLIKS